MGIAAGVAATAMIGSAAKAQSVKLGSPRKTMYWVATVTPCNAKGMFDPGAMAAIMQWHKSQGADGVVVLGTSGEFPSFSQAERKTVTETVLKNRNGLNVIVGPGTSNIIETIDLATHAEKNGADGLLVIPPFYFNQPPVEGLTDYYKRLMDACGLPTNLYHIPGTSEVGIPIELLNNLKGYSHLAGIKDSSGSVEGYQAFLAAAPALNMRCGTNNNLESALEAGMGTILADGNQFSGKCAAIFKAYHAKGDWKGELAKLRAAQRVMRDANMGANTYATMKYVLSLEMGGPEIYARTPYPQLTDAQKASLKAGLAKVKAMA
ncbi:putative DapA-like lyase [Polymorphobacter multimanifer]|uniref:4-hydroxy-tetrahydrodipicolinate synthase n=1 Tax=Polymorphobacter multimanifer TaxID=1070431 RepID=A0A841LGY0_9SPHN|nr:dihydrodipicolinate synthase family protein [Polymorphobacter multimanifer]MBB6229055.1 4-hydroxy-tetrahydrodipicolinate synthase [Polymorphobacter multimanifer]GGI77050.1 putative DapA-like lyase [Polymorphobacter multimanifer]